ncbi:MAG: hypothetical protein J3K34DRAFT_241729 [Monoraphidium minutum]|nr:MAG: hypothetical protein J3K34DRAFT_241729 [Monoraphidium minutum]
MPRGPARRALLLLRGAINVRAAQRAPRVNTPWAGRPRARAGATRCAWPRRRPLESTIEKTNAMPAAARPPPQRDARSSSDTCSEQNHPLFKPRTPLPHAPARSLVSRSLWVSHARARAPPRRSPELLAFPPARGPPRGSATPYSKKTAGRKTSRRISINRTQGNKRRGATAPARAPSLRPAPAARAAAPPPGARAGAAPGRG